MGLVGEAHGMRGVGQRQAVAQQRPGPRHPPVAQPGQRRQAVAPGELLDQRGAVAVLRHRQGLQVRRAGWVRGHTRAQQRADIRRVVCRRRTGLRMCRQQAEQGGGEAFAALRVGDGIGRERVQPGLAERRIANHGTGQAGPARKQREFVIPEPVRIDIGHAVPQRRVRGAPGMDLTGRNHHQIALARGLRRAMHGEGAMALRDGADGPGVVEMRRIAVAAQVCDQDIAGQAGAAMPDMLRNRHEQVRM